MQRSVYTDLFTESFTDWNEIMLVPGSGSIVNLGFFLSVFYLSVIHLLIYHINTSIKVVLSGTKIRVSKWGASAETACAVKMGAVLDMPKSRMLGTFRPLLLDS